MRQESWAWSRNPAIQPEISVFLKGAALVRFLDKANFGGDGKQPQVTLRLHQPETEISWLLRLLPPGRLYGPYEYTYKDGGTRRFYQLMYRGQNLRDDLLPFLESEDWREIAPEAFEKYSTMRRRYRI